MNSTLENFPTDVLYKKSNILLNSYDACIVIPYGRKVIVWFKMINNNPTCILCELSSEKKIMNYSIKLMAFNKELCKNIGTIFYGVIIKKNNIIIEDIYYYKGLNISEKSYKYKFEQYKNFFCSEFENIKYNELDISLAIIKHKYEEVKENVINIPYDIYSVKLIRLNTNNSKIIVSKNNTELRKIKLIFNVKKTNKCELYELYVVDNNKDILYDYLAINNLKNSIWMKNIFKDVNSYIAIECAYDKKIGWIPLNVNTSNKYIAKLSDVRKYN